MLTHERCTTVDFVGASWVCLCMCCFPVFQRGTEKYQGSAQPSDKRGKWGVAWYKDQDYPENTVEEQVTSPFLFAFTYNFLLFTFVYQHVSYIPSLTPSIALSIQIHYHHSFSPFSIAHLNHPLGQIPLCLNETKLYFD